MVFRLLFGHRWLSISPMIFKIIALFIVIAVTLDHIWTCHTEPKSLPQQLPKLLVKWKWEQKLKKKKKQAWKEKQIKERFWQTLEAKKLTDNWCWPGRTADEALVQRGQQEGGWMIHCTHGGLGNGGICHPEGDSGLGCWLNTLVRSNEVHRSLPECSS